MNLKKCIAALFLAFLGLWAIRFLLGFVVDFDGLTRKEFSTIQQTISVRSLSSIQYEKAVSNNWVDLRKGGPVQQLDVSVAGQLEVYAMEAAVQALTDTFDTDVKTARAIVEEFNIRVRIENLEGLAPHRSLRWVLKVPEDQFDAAVAAFKKVGALSDFQVTKEDRSEEVRQLVARRQSLIEYRDSLIALRSAEGKVAEFVTLEGQVQEIVRQIEELGVTLGDYVQEQSYSNIRFDLVEQKAGVVRDEDYPLWARAIDAFAWTIQVFFVLGILIAILGMGWWSWRVLRAQPAA